MFDIFSNTREGSSVGNRYPSYRSKSSRKSYFYHCNIWTCALYIRLMRRVLENFSNQTAGFASFWGNFQGKMEPKSLYKQLFWRVVTFYNRKFPPGIFRRKWRINFVCKIFTSNLHSTAGHFKKENLKFDIPVIFPPILKSQSILKKTSVLLHSATYKLLYGERAKKGAQIVLVMENFEN